MINDEWEVFKKEVKPIKESGIIKDSSKKIQRQQLPLLQKKPQSYKKSHEPN